MGAKEKERDATFCFLVVGLISVPNPNDQCLNQVRTVSSSPLDFHVARAVSPRRAFTNHGTVLTLERSR